MKSKIIFIFLTAISFAIQSQTIRPITTEEQNRVTTVCSWFKSNVPQSFSGCTADMTDCSTISCGEFTQGKYWISADAKDRPTMQCYDFQITFTSPTKDNPSDAQTIATNNAITEMQKGASANKDYVSAQYAIASTLENKSITTVEVIGNLIPDITLYYDKNITPQKISVPVATSFAMLYAQPKVYPLDENGFPVEQLINDVHGDIAVIVLGKNSATTQMDWDGSDETKVETIQLHDVTPLSNDGSGNVTPPVELQNIVIKITGDADNIQTIINQINWTALTALLGK